MRTNFPWALLLLLAAAPPRRRTPAPRAEAAQPLRLRRAASGSPPSSISRFSGRPDRPTGESWAATIRPPRRTTSPRSSPSRPDDSIAVALRRNSAFRDGVWSLVAAPRRSGRGGIVFRMAGEKDFLVLLLDLATGDARLLRLPRWHARRSSAKATAKFGSEWGVLAISAAGPKISAEWDGQAAPAGDRSEPVAGRSGMATAGPGSCVVRRVRSGAAAESGRPIHGATGATGRRSETFRLSTFRITAGLTGFRSASIVIVPVTPGNPWSRQSVADALALRRAGAADGVGEQPRGVVGERGDRVGSAP